MKQFLDKEISNNLSESETRLRDVLCGYHSMTVANAVTAWIQEPDCSPHARTQIRGSVRWWPADKHDPPKNGKPFLARVMSKEQTKSQTIMHVVLTYNEQLDVFEDWNGYSPTDCILEWTPFFS